MISVFWSAHGRGSRAAKLTRIISAMQLPVTQTQIQIRYFDIDTMGHVSNSAYLQYCDMGRVDFFTRAAELSGSENRQSNVIVNINMDFVHEILFQDSIHVVTWCEHVGHKSMTLQQYIFANEALATRIAVTVVGWDKELRQTRALPSDWNPSDISSHPRLKTI
jgi:acyl-CoA thioester hydrolase